MDCFKKLYDWDFCGNFASQYEYLDWMYISLKQMRFAMFDFLESFLKHFLFKKQETKKFISM